LPRLPLAYITEGNPGVCHCRIRPLLKPGIRVPLHMTTASLIAEAVISAAEELRVAHIAFSRNR
jgi:hypothetical protein